MGLLTGKFTADTTFPSNDQRHVARNGTLDSRTVRQPRTGSTNSPRSARCSPATAARSRKAHSHGSGHAAPTTIPIPGFKTVAQVEENCGALDKGPLTSAQMDEIDSILGRVHLTPS